MKIKYELLAIKIMFWILAILYGYMILSNATQIEEIKERQEIPVYRFIEPEDQEDVHIERDRILEEQIQKQG